MRAQGYVMWDHEWLLNWRFFNSMWTRPNLPDLDEFRRRERDMVKSVNRRRKLYRQGARGWWSEVDESRLTWYERPLEWSNDEFELFQM